MIIIRTSTITGVTHQRDLPVTQEQIDRYEAGALLQVAFPDLPAPEREYIKSGVTPEEWLQHVGEEED
jgi:hypothetical protein